MARNSENHWGKQNWAYEKIKSSQVSCKEGREYIAFKIMLLKIYFSFSFLFFFL